MSCKKRLNSELEQIILRQVEGETKIIWVQEGEKEILAMLLRK